MDPLRIFRWYPPSRIEGEDHVRPGHWVPVVTVHEEDLAPFLLATTHNLYTAFYQVSHEWPTSRPYETVAVIPKAMLSEEV